MAGWRTVNKWNRKGGWMLPKNNTDEELLRVRVTNESRVLVVCSCRAVSAVRDDSGN